MGAEFQTDAPRADVSLFVLQVPQMPSNNPLVVLRSSKVVLRTSGRPQCEEDVIKESMRSRFVRKSEQNMIK